MNVTRSNFDDAIKELSAHIDECEFIAIDEEMTGIRWCGAVGTPPYTDKPAESFKQADAAAINQAQAASALSGIHSLDDLTNERYTKMRAVASTYAIIQFGLCLFTRDKSNKNSYVARPINF